MRGSIQSNIQELQKRILSSCRKSGRNPDTVTVIPATKTVPVETILKAADLGHNVVAENRVQEAEEKIEARSDRTGDLEWHFISHLQSNQVNKVVRFA